jgi:hypothetical protein
VTDAFAQGIPQFIDARAGSVDDEFRAVDDGAQQTTFPADGLLKAGTVFTERVFASGFCVALEEDIVGGLQKDHFAVHALVAQLAHQFRNRGQVIFAVACIDAHGQVVVAAGSRAADLGKHGLHQHGRDIVDAVEVHVLKQIQGHALPGTGQTTDNDQAHAYWSAPFSWAAV